MNNLNLSKKEKQALSDLSKQKGMSEDQVLRQAFRVYQTIEKRLELGLIQKKDLQDLIDDNPVGLCLAHEDD